MLITAFALLGLVSATRAVHLAADQIRVRFREGVSHGFLVIRTLDGKVIADGETTQHVDGSRISARLVFRFHNGSIYEDSTESSQNGNFRLLTDHLVEKGPSFKTPMETMINTSTGEVSVHYTDEDGQTKSIQEHMDLPPDLANGLLTTLLKDISPHAQATTVSFLTASPKPRLVKMIITAAGREPVTRGTIEAATIHYIIKVKLGGVTGAIAPLLGKEPPDTHVWILAGSAPAFLKLQGALYEGGPIWRIEAATPTRFPS